MRRGFARARARRAHARSAPSDPRAARRTEDRRARRRRSALPRFPALARAPPDQPGECRPGARAGSGRSRQPSRQPPGRIAHGRFPRARGDARPSSSIRPRWRGLALDGGGRARERAEDNGSQEVSTTNRLRIDNSSSDEWSGLQRIAFAPCWPSTYLRSRRPGSRASTTESTTESTTNRQREPAGARGIDRDAPGQSVRRAAAAAADSITCVRSGCSMSRRHGSCPGAVTTARRRERRRREESAMKLIYGSLSGLLGRREGTRQGRRARRGADAEPRWRARGCRATRAG